MSQLASKQSGERGTVLAPEGFRGTNFLASAGVEATIRA